MVNLIGYSANVKKDARVSLAYEDAAKLVVGVFPAAFDDRHAHRIKLTQALAVQRIASQLCADAAALAAHASLMTAPSTPDVIKEQLAQTAPMLRNAARSMCALSMGLGVDFNHAFMGSDGAYPKPTDFHKP